MVPYGGFWRRVLAYIIDYLVVNAAISMLSALTGAGLMLPFNAFGLDGDSVTGAFIASALGFTFVLTWLYFAVMECSNLQATLGKLAVGVVVTDLDGKRISFLRATGRYFAKFLSALILGIGFLMVGWTQRKQGLHDHAAGTLVYKTRDPRQVESPEGVFS